ncbi:MAG TPA: hypothetical protein VMS86_01185 [Thermoanaerobaculia bacterium]|nr:hypothetical protein [Thermoanaerobaculia bacterium]
MAVTPGRAWPASIGAVVGVAAFLLAAAPGEGQYLNAYKAGLEAIEAQDWEQAASSMSAAILERRDEKMKLPVRLFRRPYIPHFYLGYARFKLDDCDAALAAWAESDRQGVLAKLDEAEVARRGREECAQRTRQREIGPVRQEARRLLSRTSVGAAALLDLARGEDARDVWSRGSPSPSSRHAEGVDLMRQARELLADDRLDRDTILRAEALTREAGAIFDAVRTDLERLIQEHRVEIADREESIDARVASARAILARTSYLAPYPRLVRKARADLEGLVAESQRRERRSQVHLDGLAARLETSIEELERLTAAPPETLDAAVAAYLRGRHQEVVEALAATELGERRARAHARLLLAASRHALYLEGGELDHELRAAAADDARACRRDDASIAPTERFFSPRFIAFFDQSIASTPPG